MRQAPAPASRAMAPAENTRAKQADMPDAPEPQEGDTEPGAAQPMGGADAGTTPTDPPSLPETPGGDPPAQGAAPPLGSDAEASSPASGIRPADATPMEAGATLAQHQHADAPAAEQPDAVLQAIQALAAQVTGMSEQLKATQDEVAELQDLPLRRGGDQGGRLRQPMGMQH